MIVIKTKLKKIPEKCNKCAYSYLDRGDRFCGALVKNGLNPLCDYEFNKGKNNWEYKRRRDCPLVEVGAENGRT